MAGFLLASSLEPDPRGFGTHQRLGLPPCTMQLMFRLPCPSCGGTTCFALFVRGRWFDAVRANPSVFGLALLCSVMIPWSLYSASVGAAWRIRQPDVTLAWVLGTFCVLLLLQWLATLAIATWV